MAVCLADLNRTRACWPGRGSRRWEGHGGRRLRTGGQRCFAGGSEAGCWRRPRHVLFTQRRWDVPPRGGAADAEPLPAPASSHGAASSAGTVLNGRTMASSTRLVPGPAATCQSRWRASGAAPAQQPVRCSPAVPGACPLPRRPRVSGVVLCLSPGGWRCRGPSGSLPEPPVPHHARASILQSGASWEGSRLGLRAAYQDARRLQRGWAPGGHAAHRNSL